MGLAPEASHTSQKVLSMEGLFYMMRQHTPGSFERDCRNQVARINRRARQRERAGISSLHMDEYERAERLAAQEQKRKDRAARDAARRAETAGRPGGNGGGGKQKKGRHS